MFTFKLLFKLTDPMAHCSQLGHAEYRISMDIFLNYFIRFIILVTYKNCVVNYTLKPDALTKINSKSQEGEILFVHVD